MAKAIVTSKGQITLPKIVRDKLGISTGDRIEFIEVAEGQFSLVAANEPVHSLKGILRKPKKPVTIEAMNEAIARRGSKK